MRKEIIRDCTLYHSDCFGILPEISGADCVITDPPYGCTCNQWDKPIDLPLFWQLVNAASVENAAQCVFCQMPFAAELFCANRKNFRYEYVYVKPKLVGYLDANKKPLKAHEVIFVFYRKFPVYNPQMDKGEPYLKKLNGISKNYGRARRVLSASSGERYPTTIMSPVHDVCFYTAGKKPFPQHPTPKSVAALEILVKTYTNPGQTILDPFMGSGSTGVACVNAGRKFVGIEMEEKYFDVACRRIEQAYADRSLLDAMAEAKVEKKSDGLPLLQEGA